MYKKLEIMKTFIEGLNKSQQVEILKIIKNGTSAKINENRNGIYINMSFLEESTIAELEKYIQYITDQENSIETIEAQKITLKNSMSYPEDIIFRTII